MIPLDAIESLEVFEKEMHKRISDLYRLFPLHVKMSLDEEEAISKSKGVTERYLRYRNCEVLFKVMPYSDYMVSKYFQLSERANKRLEQYELMQKGYKRLVEILEWKFDILKRSLSEVEKDKLFYAECLLLNTSLARELSKLENLDSPSGYIYLIKEKQTYTYKIGRSSNIKNRLDVFGVKLPFEWDIVAIYKVDNATETESQLHVQFKEKRKMGEWFQLDSHDLMKFYAFFSKTSVEEPLQSYASFEKILEEQELKFRQELNADINETDISKLKDRILEVINQQPNQL
ncbi:GIY-YIG nuclease family protein (plasmid) [Brevibacillus laterosporus]|uniref:GIY-YIG nuclease family protein n=1 Tax=Brevibacillus laterosporus TaxID=1465 RepID=A0A518V232_BRELA|nr:GIY-YIG nuclease family protein [Brevibacillus laterosporus]